MLRRHDAACRFGEGNHRNEYLRVFDQLLEMPLLARSAAMKARLAGEGIPGGHVCAKHMRETGIPAGDVPRSDDADALALDRSVGESRIVAELLTTGARLPPVFGWAVVPGRLI